MEQPILEVKNLSKRFKDFVAVDSLSFNIGEGDIVGLLGPNGAGKTTTIQMLLGVLTPTEGEVRYFGKSLTHHREEILEQVNFSTTYTNLPRGLSVRENLTFISYLYSISNRKARVNEVIEVFKLEDIVKKTMNQLSAGQLTRVNLAKAFINEPKVLLLDEPTASLDPDIADYIRKFILKRRTEHNMSIIWTSHNMAEVEEMCDRVIFINHGKIVADDTPANLARTIQISHVELLIRSGLDQAIEYCIKHHLSHEVQKKMLIVNVNEKDIPKFLRDLMDEDVIYDEIRIETPNLEDYFLQIALSHENT